MAYLAHVRCTRIFCLTQESVFRPTCAHETSESILSSAAYYWRIQGRGPRFPLLLLDQTEARRAEKRFLETALPLPLPLPLPPISGWG